MKVLSVAAALITLSCMLAPGATPAHGATGKASAACATPSGRRGARATLVLGVPRSVTILTYRGRAARAARIGHPPVGRPTAVRVFRGPATVETIVRLLNSMNPVPKNAHTACPVATFLRQDALRFTYDNGDRWTVYLSYAGCAVAWTHGVAAWNLGGRSRSQTVFGYVMRLFS